jgi:hypothetical protein
MADAEVAKTPVPCAPDLDQNGVDLAQIRQMLDLTPAERLRTITGFMSSLLTLRSRNEARRSG